ncbi:MAG: hypothetical protein EOO62_23020 [Hymenobacter sp.]|nr:MAG: hypothetical protein EOO62_23020 [Hymenobacter sp.]
MQFHEAQKLLADLQRINPELTCDAVRTGALVATSLGTFYVSISAGKLTAADGQEFMAVSAAAPIAGALHGRRAGEEVSFNGKAISIKQIA